jgi:uncharacterized Zn-finger protein
LTRICWIRQTFFSFFPKVLYSHYSWCPISLEFRLKLLRFSTPPSPHHIIPILHIRYSSMRPIRVLSTAAASELSTKQPSALQDPRYDYKPIIPSLQPLIPDFHTQSVDNYTGSAVCPGGGGLCFLNVIIVRGYFKIRVPTG